MGHILISRWEVIKAFLASPTGSFTVQKKPDGRLKGLWGFLLKGFTDTDQLLCYLLKKGSAVISSL